MGYIPQFEPWIGDEELALLTECISDNWITGGKKVKEFERKIAELCDVKYAITCCNGTLALFMGLKALGVGIGDEVIVPDFTFIASANSVVLAGARPVFVDIDSKTLNIDPERIEASITPDTKAIMPVHIFGQSADMDAIADIAKRHKLPIIEDAAQGIGVTWNGKPAGGLGRVGILSFYADKTMTTGEGGAVLTDDQDIADTCLRLAHQGNPGKGQYIHDTIGYNFRMTDLQAAIGLAQLGKLPEIVRAKRANEKLYRELLGDIVAFPDVDTRCSNVPFRTVILVDNPKRLADYLSENGIGARRVFYPLHAQPCYENWYDELRYRPHHDFRNSVATYNFGLALPSAAKLTQRQIEQVCDCTRKFIA